MVAERVVAILWMTFACLLFAFMIGAMSTFLSALDNKGRVKAEKLLVINEFCKQANIEPRLKGKMKKALEYQTNNYHFMVFEKNSVLEGIPIPLRHMVPSLARASRSP
jgi:hypothetical protein